MFDWFNLENAVNKYAEVSELRSSESRLLTCALTNQLSSFDDKWPNEFHKLLICINILI